MLAFICNESEKSSFYLVLIARGCHYITVFSAIAPCTWHLPLHNGPRPTAFLSGPAFSLPLHCGGEISISFFHSHTQPFSCLRPPIRSECSPQTPFLLLGRYVRLSVAILYFSHNLQS